MSLNKHFCPSPWFHLKINNIGGYEYCRWADKSKLNDLQVIKNKDTIQWFQHGIKDIRQSMLAGNPLPACNRCYLVESHGKVSGRQRQLLKVGITVDQFEKTFRSSPWIDEFKSTLEKNGHTDQWPQDWQIDLGNFCNSACLFCTPTSSSRLATEFKKIGFIDQIPAANWSENRDNLDFFIEVLSLSPKMTYLHFIGGETVIMPSFAQILSALISRGMNKNISIGFTTNLTVWNQSVVDLLVQFKEVNLGMSIECIHPLNDYVRYGGDIKTTVKILKQWLDLAKQMHWLSQLRITPTVFTLWHLDTIYEYAYQKELAVESCNFLDNPMFMRPSVLPTEYRQKVINKLMDWISKHQIMMTQDSVVNTRNPSLFHQQILEDATSYVNYLQHQPDESFRLPDLVNYIKAIEKNRKNSIIDYLPEYESILRSVGY